MAAIPLQLLLNKLQLFRLTQHRFILMQTVAFTGVLYVSACTKITLGHVNIKALQRKTQ